jgi:hypothetical protein
MKLSCEDGSGGDGVLLAEIYKLCYGCYPWLGILLDALVPHR